MCLLLLYIMTTPETDISHSSFVQFQVTLSESLSCDASTQTPFLEILLLSLNPKSLSISFSLSVFVFLKVWDFPGQIDFFDPAFDSNVIFGGSGALVFVIDVQVGTFLEFRGEAC